MENTNNNNKNTQGFTLIELLAVIIIMAILMMVALPAVTRAIAKSRRNTYATNAKKFIDAARTNIIGGDLFVTQGGGQTTVNSECQTPAPGSYVAVPLDGIILERGGSSSSFGKPYAGGYVIIVNKPYDASVPADKQGDNFDYYFIGVDTGKNGVDDFTIESALTRAAVKTGNADATAKLSQIGSALTLSGTSYSFDATCKEE